MNLMRLAEVPYHLCSLCASVFPMTERHSKQNRDEETINGEFEKKSHDFLPLRLMTFISTVNHTVNELLKL